MKRTIQLKESELVNLINKVINEAESHNCKCCRTGPNLPSPLGFPIHQSHRQCCKKCKDEQAGMVSSGGRRREFNEQSMDQEPLTKKNSQEEFMMGPVKEFCETWSGSHNADFNCEYNSPCHDILKAVSKMKKNGCDPTTR